MKFVFWCPRDGQVENYDAERQEAAVDEHHGDGNPLGNGVRVGDGDVGEEEHAVEGDGEEFELFVPGLLVSVRLNTGRLLFLVLP